MCEGGSLENDRAILLARGSQGSLPQEKSPDVGLSQQMLLIHSTARPPCSIVTKGKMHYIYVCLGLHIRKMTFKGPSLATYFCKLGVSTAFKNQAAGWGLSVQSMSPWDISDADLKDRLASRTLVLLLLFQHHWNNGATFMMDRGLCMHLPRASDIS